MNQDRPTQPAQDNQEAAEAVRLEHTIVSQEDAEQAADKYADEHGCSYALESELRPCFLAGAKWQQSEITALKQQVAELNLHLANSDALKDSYLTRLTEAEKREKELVAEIKALKESRRMISDARDRWMKSSDEYKAQLARAEELIRAEVPLKIAQAYFASLEAGKGKA